MMLLVLTIASGVLAWMRMAAWWVIVPPSVMLLGYLLLLREASKADAARREMAAYRMARAASERVGAGCGAAPMGPVVPGCDGWGGSCGEDRRHPAAAGAAQEQIYDQYADAKLRAVGD